MGHIQKVYEISHFDDGDGDVVKIYSYNVDKFNQSVRSVVCLVGWSFASQEEQQRKHLCGGVAGGAGQIYC